MSATITYTENISQNSFQTQLHDRTSRVLGIEGIQKLQNGNICIIGPICDLTYEVAKDLVLTGVKNLKLCLESAESAKLTDIKSQSDDFIPGQIHKTSIRRFISEIKSLNPSSQISSTDSSDEDPINSVIIAIGQSIEVQKMLNKSDPSNKLIFFGVSSDDSSDSTSTFKFDFFNDFRTHTIIDTDGENYELLTMLAPTKTSDPNLWTIKTNSVHNLSNNDLIEFKFGDDQIRTRIVKTSNATTFVIGISENKSLETHLESFTNGYIQRCKEPLVINHQPIQDYLTSNVDISSLSPLIQSYFGAVLASEAIKGIICKYIPFNQSYQFEYSKEIALRPNKELQTKLNDLKCFIVGSGAIGCELLKCLVSVGAATSDTGKIEITDPDHIEISNLSRQFLFRSENVGQSKSAVAAAKIQQFNPQTKIVSYEEKLSDSNSEFVEKHFTKANLILNALDNMAARRYVDSQCVKYGKALFESGTLGTKGNTQPVIPHITESYSASQDQEQEQSFPACTLKNFPTLIQHTIHWGMDDFDGLFNKQPQMLKKYLDSVAKSESDFESQIPSNETNTVKNQLSLLLTKLQTIRSKSDYVQWAYELWSERFEHRIGRLLKNHPQDQTNEDGSKFWSNGKRCPLIHNFDKSNSTYVDYVLATANLLAQTYQIKSLDQISQTITRTDIIDAKLNSDSAYTDDPDTFAELDAYPAVDPVAIPDYVISPAEFEKDDDTNYHIMYVQSASNSRALNYQIEPKSFYETKGIAGRIIPAMATTTAIVANLICIEMLKYVANPSRPITDYASTFINLADNMIIQSEPMPPAKTETNGVKFTEWDKFESSSDMVLKDFISEWEAKFKAVMSLVAADERILYMAVANESKLYKKLSEIVDGRMEIAMSGEDETGKEVDFPIIRLR